MGKRIEFAVKYNQDLKQYIAKNYPEVIDFRILSQSLDARGASRGKIPIYSYIIEAKTKDQDFSTISEEFPNLGPLKDKPIIIGAGPAGLFCALRLAEYGVPSIILERGAPAGERMLEISKHWRRGIFNEETNVCYGEGGAGLFSDGKLITRIKSDFIQYVMNKFVEFGAPAETAYMSNPHLGSNKIRNIISKITDSLKNQGCEIHYHQPVQHLLTEKNKIVGVETKSGTKFLGNQIILATGHSAKNIYDECKRLGISLKAKDFAVGVRIEHPRNYIDKLQYGEFCSTGELGAARYRLSYQNTKTDKGTYSFCMCPGGYVLSSGTEKDGIVVNGMSNYARNSHWSNSALVVAVKSGSDFNPQDDQLGGLKFQQTIERKAYEVSKNLATGKEVPAMTLKDFMNGRISNLELPKSSSPSGLVKANMSEIFPEFVINHLQTAMNEFEKNLPGYNYKEALLLAPESRTSAPVTILRDKTTFESISHGGLYPCGEGAGYAGGITSAAVDGVKVAMSILRTEKNYFN